MNFIRFVSKLLTWCGIASFAMICTSCQEFCEEFDRTAIVVNFFSINTDDPSNITVTPLNVTATIIGIENEKQLYPSPDPAFNLPSSFSQALLPINPAADVMSFSIQNGDAPADIIFFHYTRHPRFVSPECGCVSYAEIQSVEVRRSEIQNDNETETENEITSTIIHWEITNPNVTTVTYRQAIINAENIRIYY